MELSINVENFEAGEGRSSINSPRSLEACLRSGLDPSELYSRERGDFAEKGMTKDMVKVKYDYFERKRQEKIITVRAERNAIIKFAAKRSASQPNSPAKAAATGGATAPPEKSAASGLVEAEEKRMEALRRRQEKELEKIMEREANMAELHQKIARAEAEERKKQKEHAKQVLLAKAEAEKRAKNQKAKVAAAEAEEEAKKREMQRKEAAFAEKMIKTQMEEKARAEKEARLRDEERKQKMEDYKRKTAELLKQQAELAEENRLNMLERERRVQEQLVEKKAKKAAEVADSRARAKVRIEAALHKYHEMHEQKKRDFDIAQEKAQVLLKEKNRAEVQMQKEQLEAREKKNAMRYNRLVQSFQKRTEHRKEIQEHMNSKDGGYDRLWAERMEQIKYDKFVSDLKMREKQENVQQTLRQGEFKRLQTLGRIEDADLRYEEIQNRKKNLMSSYRMEQKRSLTRKHAIADAMEMMKVTGDTKLLDKIFAGAEKNKTQVKGDKDEDGDEEGEAKAKAAATA